MNLQEIKEKVNLREYARKYHGLVCNSNGMAKCPFHPPDNNPSFVINFDGGIWKWYDPHVERGGTIPEFEAKFANCSLQQAIKNLLKRFGDKESDPYSEELLTKAAAVNNYNVPAKSTIRYVYKDQEGEAVLVKEKRILLDGEKTFLWFHKKGSQWKSKMGGHEHIPYNLDQFKDHERIIICEGEKDANTINNLEAGEFATSAPAGAGSWPDDITQYFEGKEVVFLYDVGAEKSVKNHATELKKTYPNTKVFIASVPMKKKNADITDYLDKYKTKKEKQVVFLDVLSKRREFEISKPKPILINLGDVSPEPVEWLWYNRIPLGKLTLIVGDPGHGKSFLALYLAAHITTGEPWPDIGAPIIKGSVIILTAEDGIADTVRVRADAMGADASKIFIFEGVENPDKNEIEFFSLSRHVPMLSEACKQIKDVRAIFADPVTAYLGDVEENRNAPVRAVLAPVAALSEREKISFINISHLNKDEAKKAIYRAMGSVAFIGAARAVWAISKDGNDEKRARRFLTPLKTNLSINPSSLAFSITNKGVVFEDSPIDITTEEALSPPQEIEEPWAIKEAVEFLNEIFKNDNSILANDVLKQAKENFITIGTLTRAKQKLNIHSKKMGLKNWNWIKEEKT